MSHLMALLLQFGNPSQKTATPFLSAAASISQTWTDHMFSHMPLFIISRINDLISAHFILFPHRISLNLLTEDASEGAAVSH